MGTRYLYLARHGMADAFGELTEVGRRQVDLLGARLADLPIDAIWHSPLLRAAASAQALGAHLPGVAIAEAPELVDHVPHVPDARDMPRSWAGFFDGYDQSEAAEGHRKAQALVARFARHPDAAAGTPTGAPGVVREVLVTHAYPIAWLVRDALGAPAPAWLRLTGVANAALSVLEHRDGAPATLTLFNEMSHLPLELRWTGFPPGARP